MHNVMLFVPGSDAKKLQKIPTLEAKYCCWIWKMV